MDIIARMFCKPSLDGGCLVRRVVIANEMDVENVRHGRINGSEKIFELLGPVTAVTLSDDLASSDVQCGKQRGRPVADVVMGALFRIAETYGQKRLGAVEGLNLALLIHRQHKRSFRRVEVKSHDVTYLLDEERGR